jgi:hypothetical protein
MAKNADRQALISSVILYVLARIYLLPKLGELFPLILGIDIRAMAG